MSIDVSKTIAPKSDQLNADDLIGGARTIKITKITKAESPEQPINIFFEGDEGKPYKPCKSMRRVLVQLWGKDGQEYVGRSLTIYRDNSVRFGGVDVGGIRISHMSHIDKPVTLALTASKTNRKPFTVQPLKVAENTNHQQEEELTEEQGIELNKKADDAAKNGTEAYRLFFSSCTNAEKKAIMPGHERRKKIAEQVDTPTVLDAG